MSFSSQKRMFPMRKIILYILLLLLFVAAATVQAGPTIEEQQQADAESTVVINDIQEQVEANGQYQFTAQIEQTLIPRATAENIGRGEERVDTQITADITLPDQAWLDVRFEGAGNIPSFILEQDGLDTYLHKDGERTLIENPLAGTLPSGGYLDYMQAATNVERVDNPDYPQFAIYTFDIDGESYADHVVEMLRSQLAADQQRTIVAPSSLRSMTGSGELWVDGDGYPQRQILDIVNPQINEQYDSQSHVVVDYDFTTAVSGVPLFHPETMMAAGTAENTNASGVGAVVDGETANETSSLIAAVLPASNLAAPEPTALLNIPVMLLMMGFMILIMKRPRWFRIALPVALVAIMLTSPLLRTSVHAQGNTDNPPTFTEALGLDGDEDEAALEDENSTPLNPNAPLLENEATCGTGDTLVDTDSDGTADFVENCLGTNPYSLDTDSDGITDTLEIEGFMYNGQQFYSNPLDEDTNGDGYTDNLEWPDGFGSLTNIDPDGDGIPNLWDSDNDGDGIIDSVDMDPYRYTDYQDSFSLETTLEQSSYDGYQYIEFQVQPQDEGHLQYIVSALDWPYDEEGTVKDLDNSTEDVYLIPFLSITTQDIPDESLQEMYGITVLKGENNTQELLAPLNPLSEGGQISAFTGKVAYGPGETDSVTWSSVELVWMAMMSQDERNGDDIDTEQMPLNQYVDPFRFAGLEVSKSANVDYAVLGTPNTPTDNRDLFQLMFGLEATYLSAVSPNLDEIVDRFTIPGTPITETWGLDVDDVAVTRPSEAPEHYDAVPFSAANTMVSFLNDHAYPQNEMASLIVAVTSESGTAGLADLEDGDLDLTFNLANIPTLKLRALSMSHFGHDGSAWHTLDDEELADSLAQRYDDLSGSLAALQQDYPEITEAGLYIVLSGYIATWANSVSSVITIDGVDLVPQEPDYPTIAEMLSLSEIGGPIDYIIRANGLAIPGKGLLWDDPKYSFAYLFDLVDEASYYIASTGLFVVSILFKVNYLSRMYKYGTSNLITANYRHFKQSLTTKAMNSLYSKGTYTAYLDDAANAGLKTKLATAVLKNVKTIAKVLTAVAFVVQLVFLGLEIYGHWANYSNFSSIYDYEEDFALQYAVTATILSVAFFVMGLFTVTLVFLIAFTIASFIVETIAKALGADFNAVQELTEFIAGLYADYDPYTRLNDIDFEGIEVEVDGSLIEGATATFSDEFTAEIGRERGSNNNELENSSAYAWFETDAGSTIDRRTSRGPSSCEFDWLVLTDEDGYKYAKWGKICTNELSAAFTFNSAGINRDVELLYKAEIKTRYEQCGAKSVFEDGDGCTDKTDTINLPDELDDGWDPVTIYLDILPASVDDLWSWTALNNNKPGPPYLQSDNDGDGLTYHEESLLGTDPSLWDSDGDGLSDGFEVDLQDELGADPTKYDTDNDGLNDGLEFQLGAIPNDSDSDDDGLTDGEEMFHWDGSQWTGGGWLVNINGTDYWTFSDPLGDDNDGDGLKDGSEKNGSSGPNGFNLAPTFTLEAGPLQLSPTGSEALYAAAGQTITASVNLHNLGGAAVSDVLSLCLPSALTNINVTATGNQVPTTQINGDCYEWDFSGQNLTFLQSFNVELTAQGGTGTVTGTIDVSLPYPVGGTPQVMASQVTYVQDNDAPSVQLTEPFTGTILIGDYFVMGGFSQDKDTWVDHVEVTVPAGTFTATDTNPWAYTWDLPDEGVVTVSAVAYDSVGNASAPSSVQVTVDSLAPVITSNLPPGTTISAGESYSSTINLEGTVTDNYSGLVRVQMRYNNQPWRTIWETDTLPLNTTWSGVWELPSITENAQGEHTLHLRAYDGYGNIGYSEQTIFVDLLPPSSEMTNRSFLQEEPPHVAINQPLDLYGVASDADRNPLPAGPVDLTGNLHSIGDATVWLQQETFADDDDGITVSWIGDFNGDRLGDLAIGLPAAEDGAGKVIIINGRAGDWPIPNLGELEFLAGHEPSYIGADGAGLGSLIQPAGDFNGDGFEEILIGDPANDRLFMVYGSPLAVNSDMELAASSTGHWTEIVSNVSDEPLTNAFAAAGDVNNDALADILVSTTDGSSSYVYLLVGDGTPFETQLVNVLAAAVLETSSVGVSLAGVGDVNGDFVDDFAVAFGGTVYLFEGGSGWNEQSLTNLTTAEAMASFASSDSLPTIVGAGDVNGDGVADFAYSSGSTPVVVFGDAGENFTSQTLSGFASPLSGFLTAVGDMDKDGRGDFLIGNADGDAYLILGSDLNTVAATIEGVESASSAPYISGADLAGDGSSDLIVVPSDSAAADMGYDTLSQAQPLFFNQNSLPVAGAGSNAASSTNAANESSLVSERGMGDGFMAGDATVAPAGADYTSIQEAIDSGADRVLVQPGVYYEAITLTNNVIVAGSGTGLTYLALPKDGSATTLVTADGVSNASLLNMTLLGDGSGVGISVSNGAANIALERTIVRDVGTAVSIDGSTADLDLKNNTIVGNVDGLNAVNCASVDVRNTIFAYNTGTALQYEGCAAIQNHQFNLYWANGADMLPNDPGGGELFSDPLFLDFGGNDFRVKRNSPVIDAGSPGDAVPPGAGDFADIGHMEQTGTGFVVSKDYCATCDNDGLIWGVDAFDTIQGAVDAAQTDMLNLFDGDGAQFTVGVDVGTYTESVVINWNLQLLGSDPDNTTIVGVDGPAVTLSGTVGTKVKGFTLIGDGPDPVGLLLTGGSYNVDIDYNLFKDNETGILVDGRSSGSAQFNTLVNNTTAMLVNGKYNWLDTNSNLISGNTYGLYADTISVTVIISSSLVVTQAQGAIFSDNNLLFNTVDYTNVLTGLSDIVGQDPLVTGDYAYLQLGSLAIDAGASDEPVPTGGGVRADIGWHELIIAPISILMGQPDDSVATESIGVGSVEYAIVPVAVPTSTITSTLPVSWTTAALNNPGEKLTYWTAPFTPTATGFYRIYSRAADTLGNAETNVEDWYEGAFYVDDTAPEVSLNAFHPAGFDDTWLRLTGVVTDYIGTSFDVDDVYFTINGERYDGIWSLADWEADGVTPRKFHYIFKNDTGAPILNAQIQAFAVDGAGQVGSSNIKTRNVSWVNMMSYFDASPPKIYEITIDDELNDDLPPYDVLLGGDVIHIDGEAVDPTEAPDPGPQETEGRTGINGYQISVDGGLTWDTIPAETSIVNEHNGYFTYTLDLPDGFDATTVPIKIRVADYTGLTRVHIYTFTFDTGAPRLVGEVTVDSDAAIGMHLDDSASATFSWEQPIDGSGVVEMLGSFGSGSPDIPPSIVQNETTVEEVINGPGSFWARIGAQDEVGNIDWRSYGPWWVGQMVGVDWQLTAQSLALTTDGILEIANNEWLTATEWLDDDDRPGIVQSLYATWDGLDSYIGWQGAKWDGDGTMWVYYDVNPGGTTTPVTGSVMLPFEADFTVNVSDGFTSNSWSYDGTNWVSTSATFMGHDPESGGTELYFWFDGLTPTDTFDHHRMFAYAEDDAGQVWSAFPIFNKLDGNFEYYYEWVVNTGTDLLKLPTAAQEPFLTLNSAGLPPVQDTLTHGSNVQYVLDVGNSGDRSSANVQIQLTGSAGMNYVSVDGAICNDCTATNSWLLDIPDIAAGQSHLITITAQLDADLTGLSEVTTTVQLQTNLLLPLVETLVHTLDLTAPTVTVSHNPGFAIAPGLQTILGTADDGFGTGVETVEVGLDGSNWQVATGANSWSAPIAVPAGGTFEVYVQTTDYHGQVSDVLSTTFAVDDVAPLITATVPALVGSAVITSLNGTASDPAPAGAQVKSVSAQFDSDTSSWKAGTVGTSAGNGQQPWSYPWLLPTEDGVTHTVRFRATDYGGNITYSNWFTTIVDTVAPAITVTQYITEVNEGDTNPVLAGLVTDGYAFDALTVTAYDQSGGTTVENVPVAADSWSYSLSGYPAGTHWLVLAAADTAGNTTIAGPFAVTVLGGPNCFVESDGNNVTDYATFGAAALQTALDAAAPGSLLKVAGACGQQTVTISKDVTVIGGYNSADWLATPDPDTYPTVLDAQGNGRALTIAGNVTGTIAVTIENLILTGGDAGASPGGGLYVNDADLTIVHSDILSNTALSGGGLAADNSVIMLDSVTIDGNVAGENGGGLWTGPSGNVTMTVSNSTISHNSIMNVGGGIYNGEGNQMTVVNSTLSGNVSTDSSSALYNDGDMTLTYVTVSDNPDTGFLASFLNAGSSLTMMSSIIANSGGAECAGSLITDLGYNLVEDGSCISHPTSLSGDPLLDVLADNGGDTLTHALLAGSPAIDLIPAGTNECGTGITTDQRGIIRPQGSGCDLGSYEEGLDIAPGDTSCDGSRDVIDALYIMQYEVGLRTADNDCPLEPDTLYLPSCDVNGDTFCNVVDALYIMQCEVGIANSLCPTVQPTESQVAGKTEEAAGGDAFTAAAESESPIRSSARVSTIQIGSGEIALGETNALPVWVHIPANKEMTAVTLDISFDPNLVAFEGCQTNEAAFNLSLCSLQEGNEQSTNTVSITALAVSGVNGELLLADVSFTGLAAGAANLTLTARAFEDGSGQQPRLLNGRLQVNAD